MPTTAMVIEAALNRMKPEATRSLSSRSYFHVLACLAFVVAACGGQAPQPQSAAPKQAASEVERYFPLEHNTVLSFVTSSEDTGEQGLLVIEIMRPRPDMAELRVAGRAQRLQLEPGAIRSADGGYLLKSPLSTGQTFPGSFGPVKITDVDKTVKVPAGEFKHCLETVEEASFEGAHKKTTTIYCPGVGITVRQTEAMTSQQNIFERMELKSHGPRFDSGK